MVRALDTARTTTWSNRSAPTSWPPGSGRCSGARAPRARRSRPGRALVVDVRVPVATLDGRPSSCAQGVRPPARPGLARRRGGRPARAAGRGVAAAFGGSERPSTSICPGCAASWARPRRSPATCTSCAALGVRLVDPPQPPRADDAAAHLMAGARHDVGPSSWPSSCRCACWSAPSPRTGPWPPRTRRPENIAALVTGRLDVAETSTEVVESVNSGGEVSRHPVLHPRPPGHRGRLDRS